MKQIDRLDFARAVVETRALERNMVPASAFESMLAQRNVAEIESHLRNAGYPLGQQTLDRNNFDELLRASMECFMDEIIAISPGQDYLDLFCLEYDIYNIKCLLMRSQSDSQFEGDLIRIPRARSERYAALTEGIFQKDFYLDLYEEMQQLHAQEGPKAVQEALDRRYFTRLLEIAQASQIDQYMRYAQTKVDFYNILSMLRMRRIAVRHAMDLPKEATQRIFDRVIIPGGAIPKEDVLQMHGYGNEQLLVLIGNSIYRSHLLDGIQAYGYDMELAPLEKAMDNYLTQLLKDSQYTTLGPEPILGYLHGRRMEILNFRLVLTSVLLGVPAHTVRERLRECYA